MDLFLPLEHQTSYLASMDCRVSVQTFACCRTSTVSVSLFAFGKSPVPFFVVLIFDSPLTNHLWSVYGPACLFSCGFHDAWTYATFGPSVGYWPIDS